MNYAPRHAEAKLRRLAAHFPVVLLVGARQVGKTTLARHVFPKAKLFTFDPVADLQGARADPEFFLDQHPSPLILDEVQYAPELLPAIKRRIDAHPGKGRYLLTGSQNLSLMKQVAESLAGRVAVLELESMTAAERSGAGREAVWLAAWLHDPDGFSDGKWRRRGTESVARALWRGGYPGLLELPDDLVPDFFSSYVRTYVERDVRVLGDVRDQHEFGRFLSLCAALTGQEINHSQLGREVGVTPQTAQRWLSLLRATFVSVENEAYSRNSIKRLSRKPKGYLADTGLAAHLQRLSRPESVEVSPLLGALFETMMVGEIRRLAATLSGAPTLCHFRTHGGAEVDLVLDLDGELWPIEIKCRGNPAAGDERGFKALRETYPKQRIRPNLLIAAVPEVRRLSRETTVVPWDLAAR